MRGDGIDDGADEEYRELAGFGEPGSDLALELELRDRIRVNPEALEEEFVRLPGDVAYLGAQHARALERHLRAKAEARRAWSAAFLIKRQELLDAHGKATEEMVKAAVEGDLRVRAAQDAEIVADVARAKAKTDLDAVLCKKDMVVQLGANYRAEMERDPALRRDRAAQRQY